MASPVQPGQIIADKYRVEEVLGQGGMGVVVAAVHVHLAQRVAIKFLLPAALAQAGTLARFEREGRAVVALHSEHVSRVFDVGRLPDGSPYMVMEWLDGRDLSEERRARGRLPAPEAVRHILQACDAIAEAHGLGIIHRDIKPSNLFLARRPNRPSVVKVLDFGISKTSDAAIAGLDLTQTKELIGSPLYMSPEQLRGSKNVDPRSDIWSLGATLFELITGAAPFTGDTLAELSANILTADAPRLPADAPAGLGEVVARCLEKAPDSRYQSVEALILALTPFAKDTAPLGPQAPGTNPLASTAPQAPRAASEAKAPNAPPAAPVGASPVDAHAASDAGLSLSPKGAQPANSPGGRGALRVLAAVVAVGVSAGGIALVQGNVRRSSATAPSSMSSSPVMEAPPPIRPTSSASASAVPSAPPPPPPVSASAVPAVLVGKPIRASQPSANASATPSAPPPPAPSSNVLKPQLQ